RFVPWPDGLVRRPGEVDSWKKFYPLVKFQNQLKRLGAELIDHVVLTSDYEWQVLVLSFHFIDTPFSDRLVLSGEKPKWYSISSLQVSCGSRFSKEESG